MHPLALFGARIEERFRAQLTNGVRELLFGVGRAINGPMLGDESIVVHTADERRLARG